MDEITKRTIKKAVLRLRRLLEKEDIPAILKQHGIFPDGRRVPTEKIVLLDDAGKSRRERLEAILERETISAGNDPEAGVRRYCREVAFTYLNRLIALRCMEMRALIDECIKTRGDYAGRSLRHHRFRREYPEARFDAEDVDGLKAFLCSVFGELQNDIKILFDPDDEYSIIMPSLETLRECIRALNEDITEDAFKEPELIGWVYQYFQTEEKNRVFEEVRTKKKKIEGDDIVPATSLYTERYMVDYLVQNSLGAIWMEMYPDSKLCEKWPYFVKDQDHKPRDPRPIKSLTFLDPACGSGHFLLVAFDLLIQMYQEEARLAEEAKVQKEWVVPKEKIATTIIESNLHGIDIDLRSVQLSWLVLYLKMREHQNSVDAAKFLPKKVNLVAADASLLDAPDFLSWCEERFKEEPYVLNIIKGVAKRLYGLSEIGSLARPEEDLKELIKKERERLLSVWQREKQPGQILLFQELLTPEQQELPFEKVTDVQFWDGLTRRFLRILDVFLKRTRQEMRERLFATDLQRVIVFLDLCRKRYDVVATNPPYMGSKNMGKELKEYVQRVYPLGKRDIYAAFIQRNRDWTKKRGIVAMVTQQSWMFLRSFVKMRKEILEENSIQTLAHLGANAFAEIGGEVVNSVLFTLENRKLEELHTLTAFRLVGFESPKEKQNQLLQLLDNKYGNTLPYRLRQKRITRISNKPITYWLSEKFLSLLENGTTCSHIAQVKSGVDTSDNNRFLRFFWEVSPHSSRWVGYEKGGGYCKWWGYRHYCIDWSHSGALIKHFGNVRNEKWYFKEGLTFTATASGSLPVRIMTEGRIFDRKGPAIFTNSNSNSLCAILNSRPVTYLLRALSQQFWFSEGQVALAPVSLSTNCSINGNVADVCIEIKRTLYSVELTGIDFNYRHYYLPTHFDNLEKCIEVSLSLKSILHLCEGYLEYICGQSLGLSSDELTTVYDETGVPAGWHPLIQGYDVIPQTDVCEIPKGVIEYLSSHNRINPSKNELSHIRSRLQALYEAGPGAKTEDTNNEAEVESEVLLGKRIPVPTETFLEELSGKMEIHLIGS